MQVSSVKLCVSIRMVSQTEQLTDGRSALSLRRNTSKSHPNLESRKASSMEIINCIACVGGSKNGEDMYPIIINSRGMAVYLQLHVSLKTKAD